jgi:hypothetical protein
MAIVNHQLESVQCSQASVLSIRPQGLDESGAMVTPGLRSEDDCLIDDILESTSRIRSQTDNREILSILDDIVCLVDSLN